MMAEDIQMTWPMSHEYQQTKENSHERTGINQDGRHLVVAPGLHIARYYLANRWVILAFASIVVIIGAALNWNWLVAAGVAPILVALAPCAVMCTLGLCAIKMRGGSK